MGVTRLTRSVGLLGLVLYASVLLSVIVSAAALAAREFVARDTSLVRRSLDRLGAQLASVKHAAELTTGVAPADSGFDFTRRLAQVPDVYGVLTELERSSSNAGVALGGVQRQELAAGIERLARTDLTFSLRGSYPNLKLVVLDVLGRFPQATMAQWRLRRATRPDDIEATLVLSLWGTPLSELNSAAPTSKGAR